MPLRVQYDAGPVLGPGRGGRRPGYGHAGPRRTQREWWSTRRAFWLGCQAWHSWAAASIFPGLGDGALDSHLETSGDPAQRRRIFGERIWRPIGAAQRVADGDGEPRPIPIRRGRTGLRAYSPYLGFTVVAAQAESAIEESSSATIWEMGGILSSCPLKRQRSPASGRDGSAGDLPHPGTDSAGRMRPLIAEGRASGAFSPACWWGVPDSGSAAGKAGLQAEFRRRFQRGSSRRCGARILPLRRDG